MSKQTVYGGRFHGAAIVKARRDRACDGCTRGIFAGDHYLQPEERTGNFWSATLGWRKYHYCGHCDASTPEGRQSVAAVARARETA